MEAPNGRKYNVHLLRRPSEWTDGVSSEKNTYTGLCFMQLLQIRMPDNEYCSVRRQLFKLEELSFCYSTHSNFTSTRPQQRLILDDVPNGLLHQINFRQSLARRLVGSPTRMIKKQAIALRVISHIQRACTCQTANRLTGAKISWVFSL